MNARSDRIEDLICGNVTAMKAANLGAPTEWR
jgi:hypothetical protein